MIQGPTLTLTTRGLWLGLESDCGFGFIEINTTRLTARIYQPLNKPTVISKCNQTFSLTTRGIWSLIGWNKKKNTTEQTDGESREWSQKTGDTLRLVAATCKSKSLDAPSRLLPEWRNGKIINAVIQLLHRTDAVCAGIQPAKPFCSNQTSESSEHCGRSQTEFSYCSREGKVGSLLLRRSITWNSGLCQAQIPSLCSLEKTIALRQENICLTAKREEDVMGWNSRRFVVMGNNTEERRREMLVSLRWTLLELVRVRSALSEGFIRRPRSYIWQTGWRLNGETLKFNLILWAESLLLF